MKILVTGGAGYIGSHTVVELINSGHDAVIVDDLSNSSEVVIDRIEKITGIRVPFFKINITDSKALNSVFSENNFDAVIHFAALKSVGESVKEPLKYYRTNICGLIVLIESMKEHRVHRLIFSSSATVYGEPEEIPLTETSRTGIGITNPYGQTKIMGETIIKDFSKTKPEFKATLLRYFNPIGAHESGLIGEDPSDIPNNLLPYISQVAVGKLKKLQVFGDNYDTKDGTGVRDYIHVVDLAQGHLAALNHVPKSGEPDVYNLGTGTGYSVLELIKMFESVSGRNIPFEIVEKRPGDIATCYSNPTKAEVELNWKAQKNLKQMCEDSWRWQSLNPDGYKTQ